MAIYKPSNCAPFLSTQDLTQPFNISCELNTSNERVTGYKLKILDSLNNTIFEGKQFDPIDLITSGNTGLNGSVLTLPVVIDDNGTLNHNTIQYNKTTKTYTVTTGNGKPEFHESLFKNGYPNQSYKWIITLAQGTQGSGNVRPTEDKYFDMEITSGIVLGSTPNRIQSYLSENIYKDYFIQLYQAEETGETLKPISRQLITSYDHTYGYIYPQEGKFTQENLNAADCFKIFKNTNDPNIISSANQVLFAGQTKMGWQGKDYIDPDFIALTGNGLGLTDSGFGTIEMSSQGFGENAIYIKNGKRQVWVINEPAEGGIESSVVLNDAPDGSDIYATIPIRISAEGWQTIKYQGDVGTKNNLFVILDDNGEVREYNLDSNGEIPSPNEIGVIFSSDNGKKYVSFNFSLSKAKDLSTNKYSGGSVSFTMASKPGRFICPCETKWEPTAYPYYFDQVFTMPYKTFDVKTSDFDPEFQGTLQNKTSILVKTEEAGGSTEMSSPYNGVFTLQSQDIKEGKLTLRWLRAANYDTWAEVGNNIVYVQNGTDKNRVYQADFNSSVTGEINETSIRYIPEKPIELYTDETLGYRNKNTGRIFKNTNTETYIRPFVGIEKDQKFIYSNDGWVNSSDKTIEEIDTTKWSIKTESLKKPLTPDEDKYKITSFFKSSEENPFYAYADPTVEITSEELKNPEEGTIYKVKNRFIKLNGIFSQDNNKSWVYYQWRMTDLTIGTETITEKGFDGEIAWTIYGLQNEHYYQVELYIQDEFGRVASKEITFQVQVEISEKKPFFEVEFDCETNSYKINTTSTGVVIPGLENKILKTKISEDKSFAVQEEQMKDFVANGDEFQVTDPFETIKDLVVDQGGNSDVHNLVLLKAEKRIENTTGDDTFESIKGYNAGYNYNPEDKSYSLYVTDLDKPATSSDNLFSYNKTKGDSGGKSLIPAPKNDTITINFSNILNNYFEGQVMSYHIGVDSPSTAFNDIEVRVSVTPETITPKETGLKEVSPDRNKIKVEIWQCNKQNNTHTPQSKIREKEFVFYGNPNTRKICSPWVNPARGAADSNCDYIETDVVYDKDGKKIEGGLNINGEGRYNSNSEISKPITFTKSIENLNTYAVWYDMETEVVEQADETVINYFGDYWNCRDRTIFFKEITLKIKDTTSNLWIFTDKKERLTADSTTKRSDWVENVYYYALYVNNHNAGDTREFDFNSFKIDKNYISFTPFSSGAGVARKFNCTPGQTYILSIQEANGDAYVMYFQEDGIFIKNQRVININSTGQKSGNFTIPDNCAWFAIQFRQNDNVPFDNYWNDHTNSESPIYRQTSINLPDDGHTGEEIFTNKNLTFSLILSDYNTATKQFAPLEINGKLWNGDEEVPLTEITK